MSGISIQDFGVGSDLPALQTLDLAINSGRFETITLTEQVCSGRGLPALRTLDLSRNIMRAGTGGDCVFGSEVLFQSPMLRRIEHLILPPFYSQEAVARCVKHASLLRTIPKVELPKILTHHYDSRPELAAFLPNMQLGASYPFRLAEEVQGPEVIMFMFHGQGGSWFRFGGLCAVVQQHYFRLSKASQDAIFTLMHAFDDIYYHCDSEPESAVLPLAPIYNAFQDLGEDAFENEELHHLWTHVCPHRECCTSVVIGKSWGW